MAELRTSQFFSRSPNTSLLFLVLFFLSILFFIAPQRCFAADTISINKPLIGTNKLISNEENFELGFFQPDINNNKKQYIGIWYHMSKVSQLTTVWEANRESPVTDPNSSQLKISSVDGNLILLDEDKKIVWSTNVKIPNNMSTVAVLLDDGNLQLRDQSNSSTVFWQSFDHPTTTWLPGSKFGMNKRLNLTQHLIAWKNSIDPTLGIFSVEFNPSGTGEYHTMWNNSVIYWSSGSWNSNDRSFSNIPEMINNHIFQYNYVDTAQESYVRFSILNNSLIARFVIDISGQLQQLTWVETIQKWSVTWSVPRQQCDIYAACGPNGVCNQKITTLCRCPEGFDEKNPSDWASGEYSGGCIRNSPLQCLSNSSSVNGARNDDEFQVMLNMRLASNPQTVVNSNDGESCKMFCAKNCSCTAYSYNNSGCFVWIGDLLHLEEQYDGLDAGTIFLRVALLKSLGAKRNNKLVLFSAVIGVLLIIAASFIVILVLIYRFRRRLLVKTRNVAAGTITRFRYSELKYVTENFSEKLGGGGFGTVFKGALPDSTAIAVKKLEGFQQGEKQFRTEVCTIGTLQHVNLVRLFGFCSEANKRLLVYEYMPRGSLDTQLFSKSSTVLDWKMRNSIAIGIARGLSYLHEECRQYIIHCDIKPENILLDDAFVPKLADFGLAKLLGRDFSRVLTTIRGTRGYLAPEWIKGIAITAKADVYSYGMMLFEIISGRRNFDQTDKWASSFFPTFAATKLVAGDINSLLDPSLTGNDIDLAEVERACKLAFWCIQDDEKFRPTMSQVVQVLEGIQDIDMPPIPILFKDGDGGLEKFSCCTSAETSETKYSSSTSSLIIQ